MPEGPEIKVLTEWMNSFLAGKKMIFKSGGYLIRHSQIISIVSKGKLMLITFNEKPHLLIHFGLFGNLKLMKSSMTQDGVFAFKHGRRSGEMLITMQSEDLFNNNLILGFCSGTGASFKWVINQFDEMDKLGYDAMTESVDSLKKQIQQKASKRKSIDSILTDQTIISGIGKRWRFRLYEESQIDGSTKLEKINDLRKLLDICIKVGQSMQIEYSNSFIPLAENFISVLTEPTHN